MTVDPHAAGLYPLLDPDWRERTRHAGWLVLVPFVGWPMVLGYRRSLRDREVFPGSKSASALADAPAVWDQPVKRTIVD